MHLAASWNVSISHLKTQKRLTLSFPILVDVVVAQIFSEVFGRVCEKRKKMIDHEENSSLNVSIRIHVSASLNRKRMKKKSRREKQTFFCPHFFFNGGKTFFLCVEGAKYVHD